VLSLVHRRDSLRVRSAASRFWAPSSTVTLTTTAASPTGKGRLLPPAPATANPIHPTSMPKELLAFVSWRPSTHGAAGVCSRTSLSANCRRRTCREFSCGPKEQCWHLAPRPAHGAGDLWVDPFGPFEAATWGPISENGQSTEGCGRWARTDLGAGRIGRDEGPGRHHSLRHAWPELRASLVIGCSCSSSQIEEVPAHRRAFFSSQRACPASCGGSAAA